MPALNGRAEQEVIDLIDELMVENGRFDTRSEAVEYCARYTLNKRFDEDV